jgi:protein SCO1/2
MNKVVNYVLGGLFACSAIFAHANKDDPHAHHRAMMKQDNYQRSLVNYQLPQVTLQDAAGQELSLRDAIDRDKTVVLNFIFTSCPTICPVLSRCLRTITVTLRKRKCRGTAGINKYRPRT